MPTRKQRWQNYRAALPFFARFVLSFTVKRLYKIRNDYATRYISGDGYEIGAQNSPLRCEKADSIVYIDYLSRKESSQKYNIPENECVEVDIIADANNLDNIPAGSASFLIANHVLEHCPNPVATLLGWLRILKTKGLLFLTIPNYKSNEFDFEKNPTPVSHLIGDYERARNQEDITSEHIYEHVQLIDGIHPAEKQRFSQRYREIIDSNLHTHYHVFNSNNVLGLLQVIHQQAPIMVVNSFSFDSGFELLFIIEKLPPQLRGPMKTRKDKWFNCAMLLKHSIPFMYDKILSGQRSRG